MPYTSLFNSRFKKTTFRVTLIAVAALLACYPFIVFVSLRTTGEARLVALILLLLIGARAFLSKRIISGECVPLQKPLTLTGIAICIGVIVFDSPVLITLLPVGISMVLFLLFSYSLYRPPSMIQRFAQLLDPDLPQSAVSYTRKVTYVWCAFFIFNAGFSAYTAAFCSIETWTLYNGLISYMIIAFLFAAEFCIRQMAIDREKK